VIQGVIDDAATTAKLLSLVRTGDANAALEVSGNGLTTAASLLVDPPGFDITGASSVGGDVSVGGNVQSRALVETATASVSLVQAKSGAVVLVTTPSASVVVSLPSTDVVGTTYVQGTQAALRRTATGLAPWLTHLAHHA
jgi:hypothetical protein